MKLPFFGRKPISGSGEKEMKSASVKNKRYVKMIIGRRKNASEVPSIFFVGYRNSQLTTRSDGAKIIAPI